MPSWVKASEAMGDCFPLPYAKGEASRHTDSVWMCSVKHQEQGALMWHTQRNVKERDCLLAWGWGASKGKGGSSLGRSCRPQMGQRCVFLSVGARKKTQVPCRSNKCFQFLSHLSSPKSHSSHNTKRQKGFCYHKAKGNIISDFSRFAGMSWEI